jgi:cytoskeletal protein RodZ
MADREKDIAQIKKYLSGELSARAMHQLERRALDDPFLMDALAGFEQGAPDQQANLDELALRLQQRTSPDERRIIPWGPLSIAASILIAIGAGIWYFSAPQQPLSARQSAQTDTVKKRAQPVLSTPSALSAATGQNAAPGNRLPLIARRYPAKGYHKSIDTSSGPALAANIASQYAPAVDEPVGNANPQPLEMTLYKPRPDSVSASEMIVSGTGQKISPGDKAGAGAIAQKNVPNEVALQSRAEGLSVTPDNNRTVTGTVMGDDGQPITGATVKIAGRPFGTITNAAGKFSLAEVPAGQTLSVNYIGYHSKKVKLGSQDSLTINLEPSAGALAEVAVVNKGQDSLTAAGHAHPAAGWSSYKEYLKKNAVSPDGAAGLVGLTFLVGADGSLSQFRISKSLSDAADNKAIDLVKNGPLWSAGSDGKSKEVKLSIDFHR